MPKYHSLLIRWNDGTFGVEFGSYDKSEVKYERDSYEPQYERKDLMIITTGDKQEQIQAKVDQINLEIMTDLADQLIEAGHTIVDLDARDRVILSEIGERTFHTAWSEDQEDWHTWEMKE